MYHSSLIAVLDANVLYPAPLRDYLLQLANLNLYKPAWTKIIQEEWIGNLLKNRTDLNRENLEKTRDAMNAAFPEANVNRYEDIIDSLSLPDLNDRHVLAAAIRINAAVIVTFNLKDFPANYLKLYGIKAQHPDEFIESLIEKSKSTSLQALKNQVKSLKNPSKTIDEVLQILEKCGLKLSVSNLRK